MIRHCQDCVHWVPSRVHPGDVGVCTHPTSGPRPHRIQARPLYVESIYTCLEWSEMRNILGQNRDKDRKWRRP